MKLVLYNLYLGCTLEIYEQQEKVSIARLSCHNTLINQHNLFLGSKRKTLKTKDKKLKSKKYSLRGKNKTVKPVSPEIGLSEIKLEPDDIIDVPTKGKRISAINRSFIK